jgi:hypothetical protein
MPLTRCFTAIFIFLAAIGALFGAAQDVPLLTSTMSPEEFRRCGLNKLTPDELKALNTWMLRTMVRVRTAESMMSDEGALFDASGTAVAYIEPGEDLTIYLWSGKPVAYLVEDSIYGFNGKHLGWLRDGIIYDHSGKVVGVTEEMMTGTSKYPGAKGFKPFKEFKPFEPFFSTSWSRLPLRIFLLGGAQ